MLKTLTRLTTGLAVPFLMTAAATATPVEYDFTGNIVAGPGMAPLNTYVQANNHISGYFRFDTSVLPTGPGDWTLPTAVFHVQFDTLTFDTLGATAHVSFNQDAIVFRANIPASDFPFAVTSANLALGFETFMDGYFSLSTLPHIVPPNDHTLGLSVSGPWGSDGASTDTELFITAKVPEPASLALVLVGLLGLGFLGRQQLKKAAVQS